MEDIKLRNFTYRWRLDDSQKCGCDFCQLNGENVCPMNCKKDGYYQILSEEESLIEYFNQRLREQHKKIGGKQF